MAADAALNDSVNFDIFLDSVFEPETFDTRSNDSISFDLFLNTEFQPTGYFLNALEGNLDLDSGFEPDSILVLRQPAPILDTLPANSFARSVKGRLYANDIEIPFRRASFNAPKDSLGASFSVDLAKADLSFLPTNADYKFEIGTWNGTDYDYETVFDSVKLDSRNLSRSWSSNAANDNLSFSTLIDIDDKFALAPRKNIICFDKNKTSVDLKNVEKLPINQTAGFGSNTYIENEARPFNGLNLYQVLRIAFVEICGFSNIETNIPNYPLTRCDFNISQSAKESVAPFIGNFRPIFIPLAGNVLRILDGTQVLPSDFVPTQVTADDYSGIGLGKAGGIKPDGLRLSYQSTNDYSSFKTRRAPETVTETGKIFDANYTKQTITETYKDYFDLFYPEQITRSELIKRETVIADTFGFVISSQTEEIKVDRQGKIIEINKSEMAKVPLPENNFTGSLKEVRTETQSYEYQTDVKRTRNVIPKSIKTVISAIVATDSANQYLDKDFKQEYSEAHRSGNLNKDMDYSSFPEPVKTITKTFDQTGNGQIRITETVIDILRDNFPVVTVSETTSGDPSLNNSFAKQREIVVWRTGADKINSGKPISSFVGGEIPLFFLLQMVDKELNDSGADLQQGTCEILGYSSNLKRGILVEIKDRDGTNLGKFVVVGFNYSVERGRVFSSLDLLEVR